MGHYAGEMDGPPGPRPDQNQVKDPRDVILDQAEGGLLLLLDAVNAGDPKNEIVWRIQEELRLIRRRS